MALTVSPSVAIREFDLTTIVPAVALTPGALSGVFRWGPVMTRMMVDSEATLVKTFGTPTNLNAETWFTAKNFLQYGGTMWTVRAGAVTGNTVNLNGANVCSTNGSSNNWIGTANTAGLVTGQILSFSNNTGAINPATGSGITITSVINSTMFAVSSAPLTTNVAVQLFFRDPIPFNAVASEIANSVLQTAVNSVYNNKDYINKQNSFSTGVQYIAKWPGALGNSLRVAVCDNTNAYSSNINCVSNTFINSTASYINAVAGSANLVITITGTTPASNGSVANAILGIIATSLSVGDQLAIGNSTIGTQYMGISSIGAVTNTANVYTLSLTMSNTFNRSANVSLTSFNRYWEFYNVVQISPGQSTFVTQFGNTSANDELHVVVVDQLGQFTGASGTILETYVNLSRAVDAVLPGGQTNYYGTTINQNSQYIWFANDRSTAPSANAYQVASSTSSLPFDTNFLGGQDSLSESNISFGTITNGYDMFASPEDVDVGLVMQGKAIGISSHSNTDLGTYLINNLAEARKDCVAFISPDKSLVVNQVGFEATNVATARNTYMPSSSYGFMDSGYKYQYDKYSNVWRYIPLNGDMAGLAARCDQTNDPWWSFAGFNRGNVKNVGNLAWNPRQSERDILYAAGVNSVATFPGLGTVLYGDKTLLTKPSAFDRINVRRLFITLEKSIATAAKFTLFEFNDAFTRSQFKAMIKPFLADVMGKRGIQNFLVVCDTTNNTPDIIDTNQFKAAIYIKPARSINWIILDFVAVPTGVQFSEVVGQYGG